MDGFLGRYSTYIYAILRIVSGFLLMWHGSQKLLGYPPSTGGGELSTQMAIGGLIELVGGVLIMVGLFTTIAAFISSGLMAVAYFQFHFSPQAFLPLVNKGELAVVYCFLFLYIASRGSGVWSVESIFKGSGSSTENSG
ncbi:MAG: DoxX family protein [Pyrinomonadaceae bacterium]